MDEELVRAPVMPDNEASIDSSESDESSSEEGEEGGEEGEEEEYVVEQLALGREKRATAGNRMQSLLTQEAAAGEGGLEDDADDVEFDSEQGVQSDIADSELDAMMSSSTDDDSHSDAGTDGGADEAEQDEKLERQRARERERKKVDSAFVVNVAARRARARERAQAKRAAATEATSTLKKTRITGGMAEHGAELRASSRNATVQAARATQERMREQEERRASLPNRQAGHQAQPTLTQEQRLAEAVETEEHNTSSLNYYEELEEQRRLARERLISQSKLRLQGPFVRFWSGLVEYDNGFWVRSKGDSDVEEEIAAELIRAESHAPRTSVEPAPAGTTTAMPPMYANYVTAYDGGTQTLDSLSQILFGSSDNKAAPAAQPRSTCLLSGKPARFREPYTGLEYYDMHEYQQLEALIHGQGLWSSWLHSFVQDETGTRNAAALTQYAVELYKHSLTKKADPSNNS